MRKSKAREATIAHTASWRQGLGNAWCNLGAIASRRAYGGRTLIPKRAMRRRKRGIMTITEAIHEAKEKLVEGFQDKKQEHEVEKAMREERREVKHEMKDATKRIDREMKEQEREFKRDMKELDHERRADEKIGKHLDYAEMSHDQKMKAQHEYVADRMEAEQDAERSRMEARHESEHERANARMEDCRNECLDGKHELEMQAMEDRHAEAADKLDRAANDGNPISVRQDMPIM